MARFYSRPTKFIRHVKDTGQIEVDAQESLLVPFWFADSSVSAQADGTDNDHGEDNDGIELPLGSIVKRHKVTTTIEPSTIEPQNIYMGRINLSFHDVLHPAILGQTISSTGHRGTLTPTNTSVGASAIPHLMYPSANHKVTSTNTVQASKDIDSIRLVDYYAHWFNLKKITLFDQRPVIGERWQRIPKKCKRINPFTWTGLLIINDSRTVGEVIQVQIQQYLEEMQMETPPTTIY